MKIKRFLEAEEEAQRFLKRCLTLRADTKNRVVATVDEDGNRNDIIDGPEAAAVKRASMDLTRALAELRRG